MKINPHEQLTKNIIIEIIADLHFTNFYSRVKNFKIHFKLGLLLPRIRAIYVLINGYCNMNCYF